jgi:hypothetical protein
MRKNSLRTSSRNPASHRSMGGLTWDPAAWEITREFAKEVYLFYGPKPIVQASNQMLMLKLARAARNYT